MSDPRTAKAAAWLRQDRRRLDVLIALLTTGIASLLIVGSPDDYDAGWPEVAAGVGAFGLLFFRRRHPLPLLVIAMVWTAAHIAIWQRPTPMVFATLVLLTTLCIRLDRTRAIAAGMTIAASLYVLGLISNDAELGDARAVIAIAWTAGAVGIADATRSWRSYKASAEEQLRSTLIAAQAETRQQVSEERLEIARELHDLLAHSLSVMNVQTGAALHLLRSDPDQAERSLTAARDAGRSVLDELRELLGVLRQPEEGDKAPTGSLPTFDELDELVATVRAAGLHVEWTQGGTPRRLAPAVSLAAYRIVQEALTNAAKHGTGTAQLSTLWSADEVLLSVANATHSTTGGEAGTGAGLGLIGMRERTAVHGGRMHVENDGGRHTVEVWLPVTPVSEEAAR